MDALLATLAVLAGLAALVLLAGELLHWWAATHDVTSRDAVPPSTGGGPAEAVIVLGYPRDRRGRVHPRQRWRTRIAVRSLTPDSDGLLVFTGFARPGGRSEAGVMADIARRELGFPADRIVLEERARSTWENIARSLPHVEDAGVIKIASEPIHARRARRYLAQQRPDLMPRVVRADDYRFGEQWYRKPWLAVREVFSSVQARRDLAALGITVR